MINPEAIVFDMDGVIFDSERGCLNIWMDITKDKGLSNMEQVFRRCIGTTVVSTRRILQEAYGEDFEVDAFQELASRMFYERFGEGRLPVLKGARELLIYLSQRDIKVGLASSTREVTVKQQLTDAGLIQYFDYITCGDMLKVSKPEPDIYLLACRNLGVNPKHAVAIEDSYNGIRSAYRAGMKTFMVPDVIPASEAISSLCYRIFDNLVEVKEYLVEELG